MKEKRRRGRLRDLELLVQGVEGYSNPKRELEQYVTDANLVAVAVWDAFMRGLIREKRALDLGCGTGRFAIASALMGARQAVCLDIDRDALRDARKNAERLGVEVDFVNADATRPPFRNGAFDVVFQNPPFGIWSRRGIDVEFLRSALLLGRVVYTIHKLPTLDYVRKKAAESGGRLEVLDTAVINIPPMYEHHMKRLHKVEVFLAIVFREVGPQNL